MTVNIDCCHYIIKLHFYQKDSMFLNDVRNRHVITVFRTLIKITYHLSYFRIKTVYPKMFRVKYYIWLT